MKDQYSGKNYRILDTRCRKNFSYIEYLHIVKIEYEEGGETGIAVECVYFCCRKIRSYLMPFSTCEDFEKLKLFEYESNFKLHPLGLYVFRRGGRWNLENKVSE